MNGPNLYCHIIYKWFVIGLAGACALAAASPGHAGEARVRSADARVFKAGAATSNIILAPITTNFEF